MDSISVIIFAIVFLIIIFGVLVWIIVTKNKNRRYNASGEIIFNNNTGGKFKDSSKLKNEATKISEYINGDVTVVQLSNIGGELTFTHNGKDIKVITPSDAFSEHKFIVVDGTSYSKYSIIPGERADAFYKEYIKNNGKGFITESEYKTIKEEDERLQIEKFEKILDTQASEVSKSAITIKISNIVNNNKINSYSILLDAPISDVINKYISKNVSKYLFTSFIYAGKNLLLHSERSARDLYISQDSEIKAVGFKIIKTNSEIVNYIKSSITAGDKKYNISKTKIAATPNSGSAPLCIRRHYENEGVEWNWIEICNAVFGIENVLIYVSPRTGAGVNAVIFYHSKYLDLFAMCLTQAGLDYTRETLLSIVEVFFDRTDPKYTEKMTIINILFGDYTGEGYPVYALAEEERDPKVMEAYGKYNILVDHGA